MTNTKTAATKTTAGGITLNHTVNGDTTRTIAGQTLTLRAGVRYYASRPWAERGRRTYPVTIQPMTGAPEGTAPVIVPALSYEAANALINSFNNGAMSFDGRVW